MYHEQQIILGRVTPLPPPVIPSSRPAPTLTRVLAALIEPLEDLDVVMHMLARRLECNSEMRCADELDSFARRTDREQLLKEMALASEMAASLKAFISLGTEVVG